MTEANDVVADANGQEKKEENNAEEETELESGIIRQVEYYFGDMNLVRDKFLTEQTKLDDGWVPMDVLLKFKRLAKLSADPDIIINALGKSTSGLLEISDDNKKVRRSPDMPLPEMNEERRKELQTRTVYVKGFPKDSELDNILKFFKEQGDVDNVIMRKYQDRQTKKKMFKGSVFATFKTKEDAQKFLDDKELKYGETELITLWQDNYLQKKQEEYAEKKEKKEKKNKEKEQVTKEEKESIKLPTGTVLHFTEGHNTMKREDVKDALTALGAEVAYIDFKVGDTEGWVRLSKENEAKEIAEKITDGKLKIGESEVVFKLVEGEEETKYLEKTVEGMTQRRRHQKNFSRHNKGRNFKGKQGGGRKRKHDGHEDAPPKKVQANS